MEEEEVQEQIVNYSLIYVVILLGTLSTFFAEFLNYIFVYRKSDFKDLTSNIKYTLKKLEKIDETAYGSNGYKNSLKKRS